jgi:hypothetical protein
VAVRLDREGVAVTAAERAARFKDEIKRVFGKRHHLDVAEFLDRFYPMFTEALEAHGEDVLRDHLSNE